MWVFSRYGLLSIVCARVTDSPTAKPDPKRMMVRARQYETLDELQVNAALPSLDIVCNAGTDYPYRVFVSKADVFVLLEWLGNDISYDNFKGAVASDGAGGELYLDALHEVHAVCARILRPQPIRPGNILGTVRASQKRMQSDGVIFGDETEAM